LRFLGRVDGDPQICDFVVIAEYEHVGCPSIVCGDEIVKGELRPTLESSRTAVFSAAALGFGRQTL
jgi:hypothetical protein